MSHHRESQFQEACWTYAQQVLPPEADFASVETKTGFNSLAAGAARKRRGIRAGQPDCQITYHGRITYVELKKGAGISPAQHKRHAELRRAGALVFLINTVVSLRQVFLTLGISLRYHALDAETRDLMLDARQSRQKPKRPSKVLVKLRPSKKALRVAAMATKGAFW
jgi:hypothetical protein